MIELVCKDFADLEIEFLSKFDVIVHLAALTDAASSFKDVAAVERVNVELTKRLIDKAADADIKLFIFPSSTSVYGVATSIVREEDLSAINPQSPYAESKVKVERHLESSGVPHIIFRFGTIYGTSPGMRFHTAVNKFCFQASIGEPLTVWRENRHQKRPYLEIGDAVHAINWAIKHPVGMLNNTYNVLSDNHTVDEILQEIAKYVPFEVNEVDTPLLNQYSYEVSREKIQGTGFRAIGSLEAGIFLTLCFLSRLNGVS